MLAQSSSACDSKRARHALVWFKSRESEIAVARTASQRLRPFQTNAPCCIAIEIEPTDVRQDVLVSVAGSEFAKAAGFVIDAELEAVARPWLDEIVDKILLIFLRVALCRLLAQQSSIFR